MERSILIAKDLAKNYSLGKKLSEMFFHPFRQPSIVRALDQVSFSIKSGEILGIVGPNGAGKTTLLRILADLLEPDAGTVSLWGQDYSYNKHGLRRAIGYVSSDERSSFWRLSGRHNLEFFSGLYGVSKCESKRRISRLLRQFQLEKKANESFRGYSAGTKKKFTLIRALVHEPQLILLDEVTNSLDPVSAKKTREFVRGYVSEEQGRVGVWCSHRLEEIGESCDRVLVLKQGRAIYFGRPHDEPRELCGPFGVANANLASVPANSLETVFADT